MTTTTSLDRTTVAAGVIAEYEAFANLLDRCTDHDWHTPSRCEGFAVRDVAGHVVGLAEDTAAGVPGSRTAEEEAASVRDSGPHGAAARLRTALETLRPLVAALDEAAWNGPSPLPDLTLGHGVLTLWYDTYVHADDIRAALGRPSERGNGLHASVAYLAHELTARGWGPATLALDDVPEHVIGSGGSQVSGDPLQFVLVATGRADPAPLGLDASVNIYRY
jgi:uncharacterized protein (TIGR03083 family)